MHRMCANYRLQIVLGHLEGPGAKALVSFGCGRPGRQPGAQVFWSRGSGSHVPGSSRGRLSCASRGGPEGRRQQGTRAWGPAARPAGLGRPERRVDLGGRPRAEAEQPPEAPSNSARSPGTRGAASEPAIPSQAPPRAQRSRRALAASSACAPREHPLDSCSCCSWL